jgi:hypothetical protein
MTYKVFYTDVPLPHGMSKPDLARLIPLQFATRELAVTKAREMIKRGAIVWKIEGPDGFEMSREQVESPKHAFTCGVFFGRECSCGTL